MPGVVRAATSSTSDGTESVTKTLFGRIINDLGGAAFAVTVSNHVFNVLKKGPKNKFYQWSVQLLQASVPIGVLGHTAYQSVKSFREEREGASDKIQRKMCEIMGIQDRTELYNTHTGFGRTVVDWMLSSPSASAFKIKNYYDEHFSELASKEHHSRIYILIEFRGNNLLMEITFVQLGQLELPSECKVYHNDPEFEIVTEFRRTVFSEFIRHFDTKKNVIVYDRSGLSVRKRAEIPHRVNQFDTRKLADEIERAISARLKRGYGFIGPPGNGKTLIVLELESLITDIPFIHVVSSAFQYDGDVRETYDFLKTISPCVVIFEDIDTFQLASKGQRRVSEFIEGMDQSRTDAGIVYVATLNNAKLVHSSLLDRRGRFDRVKYIGPPQTEEEVYDVLQCRYGVRTKSEPGFPLDKNTVSSVITRIIEEGLSRADICEMVDVCVINNKRMTNENLDEALKEVLETREALKKCSHSEIEFATTCVSEDGYA